MSAAGVVAFLVAEAGRDALNDPPNLDILSEALEVVEDPVIASGGVRDLDDLLNLSRLEVSGRRLDGVVVGREVTAGRFTIDEARDVLAGGGPLRAPGGVVSTTVRVGVNELDRSLSFYQDVLGFEPVRTPGAGVASAIVEAGRGQHVELIEDSNVGRPDRVTLGVEDLDRWKAHLGNLGIGIEISDDHLELADPDGLTIRLEG